MQNSIFRQCFAPTDLSDSPGIYGNGVQHNVLAYCNNIRIPKHMVYCTCHIFLKTSSSLIECSKFLSFAGGWETQFMTCCYLTQKSISHTFPTYGLINFNNVKSDSSNYHHSKISSSCINEILWNMHPSIHQQTWEVLYIYMFNVNILT